MKKYFILYLLFVTFVTSGYKKQNIKEHYEEIYTQQPYKVQLIDNVTVQNQNSITLKVANDINLNSLKTGEKILLVMPSDLNLESGGKIQAGTKFSATAVEKKKKKNPFSLSIKFIINEIIFEDTTNFIILSNPHGIAPLKSISAERILGKGREVTGTFRIGTVISDAKIMQRGIKLKPDTTTAVGICILLKTNKLNTIIKAGTSITLTFVNNLKPEIGYIKYTVKRNY